MSCIMVLGIYRSGTSAIAGVLNKSGVFMGDLFDAPAHSNVNGYFEDLEFKKLHERISKSQNVNALYKILVSIREEKHPTWGIKDPLTCLILDKITPLLPTDTKFVVIQRPIDEITNSLCRAIGYSTPDQFKSMIELYHQNLELQLSMIKQPIFTTTYESFVANHSREQVDQLCEFAGVKASEDAYTHVSSI